MFNLQLKYPRDVSLQIANLLAAHIYPRGDGKDILCQKKARYSFKRLCRGHSCLPSLAIWNGKVLSGKEREASELVHCLPPEIGFWIANHLILCGEGSKERELCCMSTAGDTEKHGVTLTLKKSRISFASCLCDFWRAPSPFSAFTIFSLFTSLQLPDIALSAI